MSGSTSNFDKIASEHIGHRCVLRDARTLECVDCSRKLVLPREQKNLSPSGPPPFRAPDKTNAASPELIALRKREALAALELVRQKRTTVEDPS